MGDFFVLVVLVLELVLVLVLVYWALFDTKLAVCVCLRVYLSSRCICAFFVCTRTPRMPSWLLCWVAPDRHMLSTPSPRSARPSAQFSKRWAFLRSAYRSLPGRPPLIEAEWIAWGKTCGERDETPTASIIRLSCFSRSLAPIVQASSVVVVTRNENNSKGGSLLIIILF